VPELEPVTPFGTAVPPERALGRFRLSARGCDQVASLALRRGSATPTQEALGLVLPGPGRFSEGGGRLAIWTGPGQWLVEQREEAGEPLEGWLKRHAPACSITDQSDGWAGVDVEAQANAAALQALLERLVNLDLRAFALGSATRTLVEHMSVIVVRRRADCVTILAMRSLAGSLWHALETKVERLEPEAFSVAADR